MASNNASAYAIGVGGIVLAFAGLSNRSVVSTLQDVVSGKKPGVGPGYKSGTFLNTLGGNATPGANLGVNNPVPGNIQAYAQQMVTAKWGAGEWDAFNKLEMSEAGWNPNATNPSSHAFGLAQALGHGTSSTRGTLSNMYGGYGLSNSEAQQANSGSAEPQLKWMINYVYATYGTPTRAWAFHLAHNWY